MEFELENPLPSLKEHQPDTVPSLFANESDHLPPSHYCYISVRRDAISLILKAQFSCNFDPFVPYLAISYVDRFISKQEIPKQRKPWMVKLLTVSCLSIAAKMMNTELSLSNLQNEGGFIFDTQSVRRMELLILTTLDWQMRPITPFSFLYFFLSLFDLRHPPLIKSLEDRASEFIYKSHYEMKVSAYKPSIVAASALLCASQELLPLEFPCFRAAIASCEYVNKEKLLKCLTVMEEIAMDINESTFDRLLCSTPTESQTTSTSNNTTLITEEIRDNNNIIRRRKLHGFCPDPVANISPTQPC
ncbi:hypothetical protein Vadar_007866 [Vaccinium darrowii]|uniref:Uncharacterized protein n=1 Tax=Vaccinium darrowii TaxID=229202 RepID=A0ACB7YVX5_9ERIC|nr:hypothetical protein Vadar_007866 [Vaccinium darrowii]